MLSHNIICICLAVTMATSYRQDFLSPPLLSVPKIYHNIERFPGAFENYFQPFAVPRDDDNYEEDNLEESLSKNTQIVVIDGPGSKRIASAVVQFAKTLADKKTAVYLVDGDTDFKRLINDVSGEESSSVAPPEVDIGFYSNVSNEASSNSSNSEDDEILFSRPSALTNPTEPSSSENLTEASTEVDSTPSATYLPPKTALVTSTPSATYLPPKTALVTSTPSASYLPPKTTLATSAPSVTYLPPKTSLAPPAPKENIAEPLFGFFLPPPESISVGRKYLPPYSDIRTKRRQ